MAVESSTVNGEARLLEFTLAGTNADESALQTLGTSDVYVVQPRSVVVLEAHWT